MHTVEPKVGCGHLAEENYEKIRSFISSDFAIIKASSVCGFSHLKQAAKLSLMSHKGKYNLSNDKSTEVLLFLTGQRQISKALEIAGINSTTKEVAWVSFSKIPEGFLDIIKIDDSLISHQFFNYSKFSIKNSFNLSLKQKIVMTKTAILPVQNR